LSAFLFDFGLRGGLSSQISISGHDAVRARSVLFCSTNINFEVLVQWISECILFLLGVKHSASFGVFSCGGVSGEIMEGLSISCVDRVDDGAAI